MAALSYRYKLSGISDPTASFLVKQALTGLERQRPSTDLRVPITQPILSALVDSTRFVFEDQYQACLFRTMYTVAFYGLLRISELTQSPSNHTINLDNVTVNKEQGTISIYIPTFKHSKKAPSHTVVLAHNHNQPGACPVHTLLAYLQYRPTSTSPALFIHDDGSAVSPSDFNSGLQRCLKHLNLTNLHIRSHSFRIGGATYAASMGLSDSQIRFLGRWNSNAFRRYIRLDSARVHGPCTSRDISTT